MGIDKHSDTVVSYMFPRLLLVVWLVSNIFGLQNTEFQATTVSESDWEVSAKSEVPALAMLECGMRCVKKESCTAILYSLDRAICTMAELATHRGGLRVAWASSVYSTDKKVLSAWYAIDNNKKGTIAMGNIFRTEDNEDAHPWLAVDLLLPQNINQVIIVERMDKFAARTNNIEVRIGNEKPPDAGTSGMEVITKNTR